VDNSKHDLKTKTKTKTKTKKIGEEIPTAIIC